MPSAADPLAASFSALVAFTFFPSAALASAFSAFASDFFAAAGFAAAGASSFKLDTASSVRPASSSINCA